MASDREIDRIDRNILTILQQEGRLPNVELAKRVGLTPTPCLERVRRLESNGYISGYAARLDPAKLDLGFVAFVTVTLERTTSDVLDQFAKRAREIDEIVECHMVGGGPDYFLKIRTRDMSAFRTFLGDQLAALPSVAQTHTYFIMEEVKTDTGLPLRAISA